METVVQVPEAQPPATLTEVLVALREQHLDAKHDGRSWGDWIRLAGYSTVISIESARGLTRSATIEHGEDEEAGEPAKSILRAFANLGWEGVDADGPYPLA